jgi:hypothetical protein
MGNRGPEAGTRFRLPEPESPVILMNWWGTGHGALLAGSEDVRCTSDASELASLQCSRGCSSSARQKLQYRPEVPVLKCAHEGEPVPDVPGATFHALGVPRIDGAGNVLINASMTGLGINPSNDQGLWFGQPGALVLVARDGWPAPDLPGVVYSNVAAIDRAVSETGWLEFTTYLSGPSVTPGLDDRAIFCGPPGDFRLVMRTGDPVPELGPDVVISGTKTMGAMISDNGTLFVGAGLAGSGLPPTYNRAYWVGARDGLQLAAWHGMPVQGCPECEPGVYFEGVGSFSFNDAGQIAFDGALAGPGIYWGNGAGRWVGPPGALVMTLRETQLVPEFGPGVRVLEPCGGLYALNRALAMLSADPSCARAPGVPTEGRCRLRPARPEPYGPRRRASIRAVP